MAVGKTSAIINFILAIIFSIFFLISWGFVESEIFRAIKHLLIYLPIGIVYCKTESFEFLTNLGLKTSLICFLDCKVSSFFDSVTSVSFIPNEG